MKQLSLFDLFDEAQSLTSAERAVESEKQSNLSPSITASSGVEKITAKDIEDCALLKQWKGIKEQYPDALLLFRVGEFYEAYKEDAREASRILNITLTHRGKAGFEMCGFPFHALDSYLPRLVRQGKRVAICDQLEEPNHKSLIKRGATRYKQIQ
jgi:hypothetical protein